MVTTINRYTFSKCTELESVTFAEGSQLKTIEEFAFDKCTKLAKVRLAFCEKSEKKYKSIKTRAFADCTTLNWIDLKCVESIAEYAFSRTALPLISLPSHIKIGEHAFESCEALKTVRFTYDTKKKQPSEIHPTTITK